MSINNWTERGSAPLGPPKFTTGGLYFPGRVAHSFSACIFEHFFFTHSAFFIEMVKFQSIFLTPRMFAEVIFAGSLESAN